MPSNRADVAPGATRRCVVSWASTTYNTRATGLQITAILGLFSALIWLVMAAAHSAITAPHSGLQLDVPIWSGIVAAVIAADYIPSLKILVHEGAHALVSLYVGARMVEVKFAPSMAPRVVHHGVPTARRAITICLAGPAAEITLGALLLTLSPPGLAALTHPLGIAGWGCLLNGIANLVPIGTLDGGQALRFFKSRADWNAP